MMRPFTPPEHLTPLGKAAWRLLRRLRPRLPSATSNYQDGSRRWQRGRWALYVSPPLRGRRTVIVMGPRVDIARFRSGGSYAIVMGWRPW